MKVSLRYRIYFLSDSFYSFGIERLEETGLVSVAARKPSLF